VLVPGFAGAIYAFRHVTSELAVRGALVIVIEPLGIGSSSRPSRADYSLTAQARRIAAVLDSLAVDSAVVVGQGVNATTVARLAAARPDLVRRLVLLEGGAAERAAGNGFRRAMQMSAGIKVFGGYGLVRKQLRSGMIAASGDPSWVTDEVLDAYLGGLERNFDAGIDAFHAVARSREPDRIADRLSQVAAPVVLLLGGAPHRSGPPDREITVLRERLPCLVIDTVPGAGHHLAEERPDAVILAVVPGLDRGCP
jgi:pimeloyl-ACP methyl ester carboxylesterase